MNWENLNMMISTFDVKSVQVIAFSANVLSSVNILALELVFEKMGIPMSQIKHKTLFPLVLD